MFPRLAEHYRSVVEDLVMSLQALASSLQSAGSTDTCYTCGDGRDGHGASFVADIGDGHMVRFLVSDCGISTLGCLLDLAEETGVVVRKGAWYSYEGDNIGQGRDNTISWMEENPGATATIETLVRQKLTEGSEVKANSMRPLAAAAKTAAADKPAPAKASEAAA